MANVRVTHNTTANDKYAIGRARMQNLVKNGAFSKIPNPLTKFPKLIRLPAPAAAPNKATTTSTAATKGQAAAKPKTPAPAVVSRTRVDSARKPAAVEGSKAPVKKR